MLKKYFILLPSYGNFTSVWITIDVCHYYYFWNYSYLRWSEFPFDWKMYSLSHCRAKETFLGTFFSDFVSVVWRLLFASELFLLFLLEVIQSSNKFIHHLFAIHLSLYYKPFTHSILSSHNTERNCYYTHFTGVKLRLAKTELFTQDHTGIRAGAVWLAWPESLYSPSLSCVTGLSIITWPALLMLHRFQFGIPN